MTETKVGIVNTVDGSVVLRSVHFDGIEIVDVIWIIGFETFKTVVEISVLGRQIVTPERIVASKGENGTFHHDYWHIGARPADDVDKVVGESVAHHLGAVGHGVEDVHVHIGTTAEVAVALADIS